MNKKTLFAVAAFAASAVFGSTAIASTYTSSTNKAVVDLGFILDESGSVGPTNYSSLKSALATAIGSIPTDDPDVVYRVGVVSFSSGARQVVAPTEITSGVIRTAVADLISDDGYNGGVTDWVAAMDKLRSIFTTAGGLGDASIANFATDGNQYENGNPDPNIAAGNMITDGWDSLSFEAIGSNITTSTLDFGFDSTLSPGDILPVIGNSGVKNCGTPVLNSSASIGNPLTDCFVIQTTFSDLDDVYRKKIVGSITGTGGTPNPIPVPAALPLLFTGFGLLGLMRTRRRKTS